MKRILFVCTGNTCRSPMAEGLFRKLVDGRDDFAVGSAGVSAFEGDQMSRNTAEVLKAEGIELPQFRSRPVTEKLIQEATHVIAMTRSHLRSLESIFPAYSEKYYLASEFTQDDSLRNRDVSDPFGGSLREYESTKQMLQKLLPDFLTFIDQTFQQDTR